MASLDELRKLFEEATGRVGEAVDEYERTPSPSAGSLRPVFGLSSTETKTASPEMDAFFARMADVRDRRDAEAASRFPPVKTREDIPREGVPSALRPSDWVTSRPISSDPFPSKTNGGPVGSPGVVPVPPPEEMSAELLGPFFRPVNEANLPPEGLRLPVKPSPAMSVTAPRVSPAPSVSGVASPIPVAGTPVKTDVPEAVKGAIAATTPTLSALPTNGQTEPDLRLISTENLRAATAGEGTSPEVRAEMARRLGSMASTPSVSATEGAGGDDELGRLSMGQALVRALEGSGSVISGQNLRSGAADTLGERMKQIEALRAKKLQTAEERALEASTWGASNRSTLASALAQWKGDPEKTAALEALASGADTTKPGDFSRNVVNAVMTKPKVLGAEAGVAKTNVQIPDIQAGTAVKVAKAAEIGPEGESKRRAREQAAALGWARLNAQSAEAAARAAEKAATTTTDSNAIRSELDKIQKITQKGGYVPLAAALEQADTAIADLGRPPSMAAQAKHALPGGDRFLSPEEKAYFNSVDKLKQMEQLAISGKVVSESERKEFVRQYGTSWYANPTAAAAYIDLLRQKTASQIRMDLATIRATPIGKEALRLYEAENGLTENAAVLKGKGAATRPAKPIAVPAGKTVLWNVAEGKWKAIPNDNAEAAVASGKYER